ncbi:MAG: tetratricopeptide repeat protein, partial [Candidatus Obscuribacterales bacterium]|nr:tetratricopeptide repeat protein [Candidatus Obscuribacterales bacterium]
IADASHAIEMHDNFAYIVRAEIYLKTEKLDLAYADVKQAIKHNPKSFYALRIAGSVYNARFEYAEAAPCFEKAYTISKLPFDLLNAISSNLLAHKYANCIKACDKALKTGVLPYLVCVNRAFAQLGMNEYENAYKDCEEAIKYAKDNELALAYASKAITHASTRRWDECLEYCEKALAIDPIFAPALNVRIYGRIALKQFDDAEADLTLLSTLPKTISSVADLFHYKALLAISKNNKEEALAFATESNLAWPGSASRISLFAMALLQAERYSEAIVEFSKAIEIDPLNAESYWYRSKAHLALGNKELSDSDKRIAEKYKYIPFF